MTSAETRKVDSASAAHVSTLLTKVTVAGPYLASICVGGGKKGDKPARNRTRRLQPSDLSKKYISRQILKHIKDKKYQKDFKNESEVLMRIIRQKSTFRDWPETSNCETNRFDRRRTPKVA